jgi:hypothetical protein
MKDKANTIKQILARYMALPPTDWTAADLAKFQPLDSGLIIRAFHRIGAFRPGTGRGKVIFAVVT